MGNQAQEIYLATNPAREGTLLGQEVLRELGLMEKVTKRVYVNDMAESQIKKSFEQPQGIENDYLLYQAGLDRQRVDWLGGIDSFELIKSENMLEGRKQKGTGSIWRVKSGAAIFIHQVNEKIDNWDENAPENNKYGIVMKTSETTSKGKVIQFNQEFFGHKFSKEEGEQLLAGKEITFKGNNGKPVVGSLKRQKYKGKSFWGFMPNWDKEKYEKPNGISD